MYINYYLSLFLISVYFSFSVGKILNDKYVYPTNENNQREMINQFEDKMKALFTNWKTETNRKLESLQQMIPDLEENISQKLYNLKNNIPDKLKELIDSKLNNLESKIPDELNQTMDKTEVNKKFNEFEESLNIKLAVLATNISNELDVNINWEPEAFKKITELDDKMNRKFNDLVTHIEDIMNRKSEFIDKEIPTKLDAMAENISKELELNNNSTFNAIKNETDYVINKHPGLNGNASTPAVNITEKPRLPCKEESVSYNVETPDYSMDDVTLNHYVTLKRNSTGHRTYFELHFALQTDGYVNIWLRESEDYPSVITCSIFVNEYEYNRTRLYHGGELIQDVITPDILSSSEFRSFYIKIDDDKLQFGKEGDTPFISYSNGNLGLLNYYSFSIWSGSAEIRYCPAAVGESTPRGRKHLMNRLRGIDLHHKEILNYCRHEKSFNCSQRVRLVFGPQPSTTEEIVVGAQL